MACTEWGFVPEQLANNSNAECWRVIRDCFVKLWIGNIYNNLITLGVSENTRSSSWCRAWVYHPVAPLYGLKLLPLARSL